MKQQDEIVTDNTSCCATEESVCRCRSNNSRSELVSNIKYIIGALVVLLALILIVVQLLKPQQPTNGEQSTPNFTSINQPSTDPTPALSKTTLNTNKTNMIGTELFAFDDLNQVAMEYDTVFIFISNDISAPVDLKTKNAIVKATMTLSAKGIKAGIFTLNTTAPDFKDFASQGQSLPTVLVSTKGNSSEFVQGSISEDKILQAYTASIKTVSSGSCCPASPGGASNGGCP